MTTKLKDRMIVKMSLKDCFDICMFMKSSQNILGIYMHLLHIFITSTYKTRTNINPCTLNFPSECPFPYKRTIIKTLISRAKILSSSRTIFLNKLKNIKQTLITNGFHNYIVDTEIKHFINKTEQHNIDNILNHKQPIS